jgi:CRP/FNR family transcriptional regulator, cyclic AMP receptor protein
MKVVIKRVRRNTNVKPKTIQSFDAQLFLDSAGVARKIVDYRRSKTLFSQGDLATSVIYIQKGGVKLSVVDPRGRQTVVALLGPGDFLGEGCLTGLRFRMGMATALTPTTVLIIEKKEMIRVLHDEVNLSERFIAHLLTKNIRIEKDLLDQRLNPIEKRLARALVSLAKHGRQDQHPRILPRVSQETLAEMIGTSRSRVNKFMNKFRKLGFVSYKGTIRIHPSLRSVVLYE